MALPDDYQTLSVREAMDRIGLRLFPEQWSGKEYLDHWRLGLNTWPPTKQRGMAAVRELLTLVWDGVVTVEAEISKANYAPLSAEQVRHFHGGESLVGDVNEFYRPCRLRFPSAMQIPLTSRGGRNGYDWPPIVVQILAYLDEHGTNQTADQITQSIRAQMEKGESKPPSYSKLQPYVSALLAYRSTLEQEFPKSNSGTDSCDPPAISR
ncbi:hypothetical protein SZ64_05895 [Erythrobacter sp. SG61-1L]|uniref:hypothetical protein n=1 Tax=Erythrobacter sp. SG61-1L TaxID=1603897 RepID=UPI0006C8FEE8|nr:hypothetical protein [Erythrobacter sp. SG61-1L]KPL67690.1 hypothetical protein SZ64_05895 [Erythrobacter sp. SG61-1L]